MTFAGRIRNAARKLRTFRANDLADAIEVRSYRERKAVRETMRDFIRRGEFFRIEPGLYRYVPLPRKITIRQRLWNIARRMKAPYFNLDDLERFTGANRETIREFCVWMVKAGYAARVKRGHYKVIGRLDPIVPSGKEKA